MNNAATHRIVVAGAPRSSMPRRLAEVWRHRELLRSLVIRNLKVKYQRSTLGFVWTLVNPLVTVALLVVVFTHVVRIPLPNYWAFLLSGYFVWNFMIQTLNTGTYLFGEHSRLTRSVAFPSEILVFGAAISRLLEFGAELTFILVAVLAFHHHGIPASLILLPLLGLMQLMLVLGLALPIATLSAFYYDVQHALPLALSSLFYISPVFYAASMVPESLQPYYFVNPMAGLLTLWHVVLYEGQFPSLTLLGGTFAYTFLVYLVGYELFRRYAAVYAEIV